MSKITLSPNGSGTGTFTIASPNSNTDRTLTLPDVGGEVVVADSSGNVGIGTDSPTFTSAYGGLHVHSTYPEVHLTGVDSGSGAGDGFKIQKNSANNVYLWNYENALMAFGTNNSERMRVLANGDVRVGTGAANNSVGPRFGGGDDNGTTGTNHLFMWPEGNGTSVVKLVSAVNSTAGRIHFRFVNSVGVVGQIITTGSSTSYATSSDYRLKTDAQPMTGASARVQALNPVNFEWLSDGSRVDGFLAHEAQAVVPEAVTGTKDAMRDEEYEVTPAVLDDEGNEVTPAVMGTRSVPDYQGIDQSKLVPLLTAALQEALTKIDDLETRLTALEAV